MRVIAGRSITIERQLRQSQRYFNRLGLLIYDFLVYRLVSKYVWGVDPGELISRYGKLVQTNHLEVGVGTGYLLVRGDLKCNTLTLMDLSQSCLLKAKKRLHRLNPIAVRHNILEPCDAVTGRSFNSVAINYVLHCVPGDFSQKQIAFKNLSHLLTDDGVLFGASVIVNGESGIVPKFVVAVLNKIGLFNNEKDTVQGLYNALAQSYEHVELTQKRTAQLFIASNNRRAFSEAIKKIENFTDSDFKK